MQLCKKLCLLQIVCLVLLLTGLDAQGDNVRVLPIARNPFKICYQLPFNGADAGFSYNNNQAAKNAQDRVQPLFTANLSMETRIYTNQAAIANMTAQMVKMIEADGCHAIMVTSRSLLMTLTNASLATMSAMYPRHLFWVFSAPVTFAARPVNVHASASDVWSNSFVLGAAAAVVCSSCVGFLLPFADYRGMATAMHRGMQFGAQFRGDGANVTALCPLFAIHYNAFNDVPTEMAFTRAMHQRGCSVLALYSNTGAGARIIQSEYLATPRGHRMYSMTIGVDGAHFIGETSLTSMLFDMEGMYTRFAVSALTSMPYVSQPATDGIKIGTVSSIAEYNVSVAVKAAKAALGPNGEAVWCTPIYNQSGGLANAVVDGTLQCIPFSQFSAMTFVERGLVQYPQFQSPLRCPAGTFANYSVFADLSLNCTLCPAGTFTAVAGRLSCALCPNGTTRSGDRTACLYPTTADTHRQHDVLLITLLCVLVPCVLAAAAFFAFLLYQSRQPVAGAVTPPPGPLVAIGIIDVDPTRSSPHWRSEILVGAYIFEVLRHSVLTAAVRHKAYIVSSVPTTFVLAADTPQQLVEVAEDVERALITHHDAYNATMVYIAAAVAFGECAVTKLSSGKMTYAGKPVEVLLRMQQNPAHHSGHCMLETLYLQLKEFDPTLEPRLERRYPVKAIAPPAAAADATAASTGLPPAEQPPDLQAVSFRFRYIPPQSSFIASAHSSSTTGSTSSKVVRASRLSHKKGSIAREKLVVQKGQTNTLLSIFECIACRFLFTASMPMQQKVASSMAAKLNIVLLPQQRNPNQDPAAANRLRHPELQQMIRYVAPLLIKDLDEMHVREQIQMIV